MRKYVLRTLLLTLLLGALFSVTAYAETATVTGSDVNFRSGPGMNYRIMDSLDKGTTVTVTDRSNSQWYAVNYNGSTGFISASYLSVQEEAPTETTSSSGESGTINAMYVRFRSSPSTSSSILGEYNKGTTVTITGTSGDWTAVTINGKPGYVFSQYITKGGSTTTPAPASTPEPTPAPTAQPASTGDTNATLNADHVHMRAGTSTSAPIRGIFNKGQRLVITGTDGDWYGVTVNGHIGYIYSAYVTPDSAAQQPEPTPEPTPAPTSEEPAPQVTNTEETAGYIKGNNVRLRTSTSTSSQILGEYNYGAALTITGTSGDWTAVTMDGKTGFVYSSYVAKGSIAVTAGESSSTSTDEGAKIAAFALQYVGYPYVWAGKSPDTGFDCSGLAYYVYGQFGYSMNRVANDQTRNGVHVDHDDLQPGDLLCFYSGSNYVGHVGIYIGDGKFVHASTYTTGVIVSELAGHYTDRGYEARRIVS